MSHADWSMWVGPALAVLAMFCGGCVRHAAAPSAGQDKAASLTGSLSVYVGTYTKSKSKGIYRLELDLAGGALGTPRLVGETTNPSFLAVHPSGRQLYAVSEVADSGGRRSGAVAAFAVEPDSGNLRLLNRQPSGGVGPCHLVVDAAGRNVLVANYASGSVAALPIGADGRLAEPSQTIQHADPTTRPGAAKPPHAHCVRIDAAGRFAFVADLGLDRVFAYRFDPDTGTLAANDPPAVAAAPGAGPRHFAFHPAGRFAYVINELDSTVTAFAYDPAGGTLTTLQTLSTLPPGFSGANSTAEVRVHPSGRFLYGSNRGHDSIAIFAIDLATGRLTALGQQSTGGRTPRNFAIDPSGQFLLAANQDSDNLVLFRIDAKTGGLAATGAVAEVPCPVCVLFVPPAE